jgi:phage terminase large subunit-like protein
VTEGKLAHDGDPILKRHVENAVADRRPRGWRISKSSSRRKIDAAIAAAIAVVRAQEIAPEVKPSIYESRGVLIL